MEVREWISGRNPVYEVLRAQRRQCFNLQIAQGVDEKGRLTEILRLAKEHKVPVSRLPRQHLDAKAENHQGVMLEVSAYPYSDLVDILELAKKRQEAPFVLVLDVLQNPQNLGVLLRTAEAAGVHGVLIPRHQATGVTPAVVHASAGATEHLLVASANLAQAIDRLKKADVWVIGLDIAPEAKLLEDVRWDGGVALVVGGEGEGMRSLVRRSCDLLVHLPMRGKIESLNAAAAGSIVLYHVMQARKPNHE